MTGGRFRFARGPGTKRSQRGLDKTAESPGRRRRRLGDFDRRRILLHELSDDGVGIETDRVRVVADEGPPEDARGPLADVIPLETLEQRQVDLGLIGDRPEGDALFFSLMAQARAEALVHG